MIVLFCHLFRTVCWLTAHLPTDKSRDKAGEQEKDGDNAAGWFRKELMAFARYVANPTA